MAWHVEAATKEKVPAYIPEVRRRDSDGLCPDSPLEPGTPSRILVLSCSRLTVDKNFILNSAFCFWENRTSDESNEAAARTF
jgi:hypothetical protein